MNYDTKHDEMLQAEYESMARAIDTATAGLPDHQVFYAAQVCQIMGSLDWGGCTAGELRQIAKAKRYDAEQCFKRILRARNLERQSK